MWLKSGLFILVPILIIARYNANVSAATGSTSNVNVKVLQQLPSGIMINDYSFISAIPLSFLINEAVASEIVKDEEEYGDSGKDELGKSWMSPITKVTYVAECSCGSKGGSRGYWVPPVTNATYAEECGACHLAYQPILLPVRSWLYLMSTLDDHFGENAELEVDTKLTLFNYLINNAADRVENRLSQKLLRSLPANQIPRRITEIPYIKRKHRELTKRMVENNPEIKSRSYCDNCHRQAEKGRYVEREVNIPGYGRHY